MEACVYKQGKRAWIDADELNLLDSVIVYRYQFIVIKLIGSRTVQANVLTHSLFTQLCDFWFLVYSVCLCFPCFSSIPCLETKSY